MTTPIQSPEKKPPAPTPVVNEKKSSVKITEKKPSVGPSSNTTITDIKPIIPFGEPANHSVLHELIGISRLVIMQELEIIEVLSGLESNNRYNIFHPNGTRIYFASERTGCCARCCFGHGRPFLINVANHKGHTVMSMKRECNVRLCWCRGKQGGSNVNVKLGSGEIIGKVKQECSFCTPTYHVYDAADELQFVIRGPFCGSFCPCLMCCDAEFQILTPAGDAQVGSITKEYNMKETISDANNFGIHFPKDLHPHLKATLLGATFCIDFSYFEGGGHVRPTERTSKKSRGPRPS